MRTNSHANAGTSSSAPAAKVTSVATRVSRAPAQVEVTATIAADPANRTLEFSAESDSYYRSSEVMLDGRDAPRLHIVTWQRLPEGTYEVRVRLSGPAGVRATAVTSIVVVARGAS